MLKILKNLLKSPIAVISIIILLCIQAMSDLELPNYTSKIVNVGIQQGGIENASPEVIRKSQMDNLLIFTDEDEKILDNYTLISKNTLDESEYKKYLKKYPEIENQKLYIKNETNKQEQEELNLVISKPLMFIYFMQNGEMSVDIKEKIISSVPQQQKNIMQNMELIEIIKAMPEEEKNKIIEQFSEKVSGMSDSIVQQSALMYVKEEYEKIGVNTDKLQNKYILMAGLQMLGIALISMTAAIIIMLLSARVAAKLGRMLREKVFKKVISFSTKEFREFSTASLITRSTNDIQQIQMLIATLFRVLIYSPIIGIGAFLKVLRESNNSMAWIIGVAILAILFVISILFIVAMPKFKKLQKLIDKLNLVSRETLTGLPVIRAFNKEKYEEKRFDDANKDLMKTNIFVNRAMSIMMPALMFIMNSIMLLIIWIGGKNVDSGIMQVGDMMAFIQYTMQIVISFLMISMISIMIPRASVSANRINEVLDTEESIKDSKKTKEFDANKKGLVEFKHVSFRYPDADTEILEDITFTAKPGETTAIIGSTGSGKSTVVNLIPRFYDVTGGELLVDGVNVKEVKQKDLRDIIGFVPQKGLLFSGTIESNIKYSDENMSNEDMIEAAKIAQAEEFINKLDDKYNYSIAQSGNNVSGGQRQRLSIARAIAKNPEIFVFDDSFSALDFKTDSKLREELLKKTKDKTVIIVAQRISTILNANQIIVLEEGKVVGKGTHNELMKSNETYRQIALSQLTQEELE
ncbi:MAG: ABC transporter ATP-binding protein [Clostridia bacterium]|nr:ABC transporter ATP-binding protein [Clostridia bacterium]